MPSEIKALAGQTVLIVEDEFLIAVDVQRIVEDAGAAHVILANSTAKARELLHTAARIDICILDLKLGEEDALPLTAELTELGIPFVVATGFDRKGTLDGLIVVQKPYHDADVLRALRQVRPPCPKT